MKQKKLSSIKKELERMQKLLTIKRYGRDCFTCPQKNLTKTNCQLGHVPWGRTELSTKAKFDTDFTRIQCFRCNIHAGGNGGKAMHRMIKEGIDIDALWKRGTKDKGKTVPRKWFEEKILEYQSLLQK